MVRSSVVAGFGRAGLLASALAILGCGAAATKPAAQAPSPSAHESASIPWASSEDWFVLVRQSCRTVSVYRKGEWEKTYHDVSFGRVRGDKEEEGDRKTPLGLYQIVGKRVHPRWQRFLLLSYPNVRDREVHEEAMKEGHVSNGPGGQIGIHGTDEPVLNESGVDWTFGCISLKNSDVREFYAMIPSGTLVLIEN